MSSSIIGSTPSTLTWATEPWSLSLLRCPWCMSWRPFMCVIHNISDLLLMVSSQFDYFGRPLGLWRTSAKLAHTLSEVLFICAWSAALSLCFDNFFTSLIPCASASATAWYNQLPRPHDDIPGFEGSLGDHICDQQLSLICLVGVGLIAYCSNLIINLYRVFEKVKYHPVQPHTALRRR